MLPSCIKAFAKDTGKTYCMGNFLYFVSNDSTVCKEKLEKYADVSVSKQLQHSHILINP